MLWGMGKDTGKEKERRDGWSKRERMFMHLFPYNIYCIYRYTQFKIESKQKCFLKDILRSPKLHFN